MKKKLLEDMKDAMKEKWGYDYEYYFNRIKNN